jgi:putative heme-binding domain-containing protein
MSSLINSEREMVFQQNCRSFEFVRIASVFCGVIAAASLSLLVVTRSFAVEAWADPNLPVKDGLELWLDGAHATGDQPFPADGKLNKWTDASGKNRNLRSPDTKAVPSIFKLGNIGVVRFDGIDDHLRSTKLGTKLESFTVVIVAAPRQNLGGFAAFASLNAAGERDYTSGLNIDLGASITGQFSVLNVEGRRFSGPQNLRTRESTFAGLHTLIVSSDAKDKTVRLMVNGHAEGSRPRDSAPISMEEITLGARYYNNDAGPQHVTGFGRIDVAEILIFNRALAPAELNSLRKYLDGRYALIKDVLPRDAEASTQLVLVKDPPPVQVFPPGFSARELPLDLTNINNLKYRPDGTLVALAYDGKIWLLRDTDHDGLEDKAELFWDNSSGLRSSIGMDLTPPGYERGNGVFVVGKTRCVLIVDTNGDDRADKEIEVAGGWKESFHAVDGLGVAFDRRDGSVYYGRGTSNFADPFLHDKEGKAQYRITDEAGTIIRVAPDFKAHEIVATGIRFPVAIRFNSRGDLFATDQEGATWLPNGNPFDELLHIQRGRHYGFPPRHPQNLPHVIDEPSTFDYSPQHQSTCGLNFNEPMRPDGPVFGPKAWAGDAIVTGYSRGRLFRTELALAPAGYVARTNLLACLNMLPADACITPDGGLVVACHSGAPDWGSGPTGKGKLFKITYTDPNYPQPVTVWPTGPREVRVEFDRPVPPEKLHDVLMQATLTGGRYVRAGDRFESLWPGYAAVQAQNLSPRFNVPMRSAQLTPDGRTLVLATDPVSRAVHYGLTLPREDSKADSISGVLPQDPVIDLDFDLSGCEATWKPSRGGAAWSGWLPHLDLDVSRQFTKDSAPHDELWNSINEPGELTLRGQLELTDMLRPAIQPGSKIDYEYPPESVTVSFNSAALKSKLQLITSGDKRIEPASTKTGSQVTFTVPADAKKLVPFEIRLTKQSGSPTLAAEWTTNEDNRPRPFPLRRLLLPWADTSDKAEDALISHQPPELDGGSWARGYREFFGEKAMCSKCHAMYWRGGTIGPDLSNLVHRDYASVLRDVTHPSFAINPDYLSYTVVLNDGRVLVGVVHSTRDTISVGDSKGVITMLKRADVQEMHPSPISTMPEKLPEQLGPERTRDLLTFLLTPPPQMPRDHPGPRPKARTVAEVRTMLAGAPNPPGKTRLVHVLFVSGAKDHGIGEHDYPAFQKTWSELLAAAYDTQVSTASEWPTTKQFKETNVIVFFQHGDWNEKRAADIDAYLKRGGGLVYIHWAVDGQKGGHEFAKRIGLAGLGLVGFRHGEETLAFNHSTKHPIIRNFDTLKLFDETYWKMAGSLPADRVLATAVEDGQPQPQLWSLEPGKGRVFVSIPGHFSWTFDDPLFRILLLRGIAWAAHEPVDRFNDLVWLGSEISR